MHTNPHDGRQALQQKGFTYIPQFISIPESEELIEYFGGLHPIWEERHRDDDRKREGSQGRRLTRPVYWLGAWQFACLGYYAEPDYRHDRCLRAEPFPAVMQSILHRTLPGLHEFHNSEPLANELPNTCLINYYGREVRDKQVPRDFARLRMHRDSEPGPVIMFNIGQAGLLEFLDPDKSDEPELSVWLRHRSICIISGPDFKDRLYHRVRQVRMGRKPELHATLSDFELRRVSVSFRHVPAEFISDYSTLPAPSRSKIADYVALLAEHSEHFQGQLNPRA
jgi:hypothetical protein